MARYTPLRALNEFIRWESAAGVILFIAAMLALIIDNSPYISWYQQLLHTTMAIKVGALELTKPLVDWVNEGLMAIFFLLIGLEVKREIIEGELSTWQKSLLPCIAALGGMIVPALIYCAFNYSDPTALKGWAIPTATDIAFALAILSLLGRRIPPALKVFLAALAIMDDLGAILIIAIYYTAHLSWPSLALASGCLSLLLLLNRCRVYQLASYILIGIVLWACVLQSGVHATLAGVVLALAIPFRGQNNKTIAPAKALEQSLSPWISFAVLPLFAFVNAGVDFSALAFRDLSDSIPLGIALGLLLGKQIGVFGACWLSVKWGLTRLPKDVTWTAMYGVSLICGVGFTMSLFIGGLAFNQQGEAYSTLVRMGVLLGSTCSGILGYVLLRNYCQQGKNHDNR